MIIEILFWISIFMILYSYIGYAVILGFAVKLKRIFFKKITINNKNYQPTVSFIVPCYNERELLREKIKNSLELDYPTDKLQIIFITDGSNDGSEELIAEYPEIDLLHNPIRKGKSAAENRSVEYANGEIIVFSDANTVLASNTIKLLVAKFIDPSVGAVSGEKRIYQDLKENAAGAGEGIYWKYESLLKKWDAELNSIVGAAGELISFRKHLFNDLEQDTILDDFVMSMRIAAKGYKVDYEPNAAAYETSSANSKEELKRKIRISAGAFQAMKKLKTDISFIKHPLLYFQYFSHRVSRWTIAPLSLILLLPLNVILAFQDSVYINILILQLTFHLAALIGYLLESKSIKVKALFVPYYFMMMNYAVVAGYLRHIKGNQSAVWERSDRKIQVAKQAA